MAADLEIGVYPWGAGKYTVDLRYEAAGQAAGAPPAVGPGGAPVRPAPRLAGVPEEYGLALWEAVFADPALRSDCSAALAAALAHLPAEGEAPLRVRLYISPNAPELHGLRWETLFNPDAAAWVATDQRAVFSRYGLSADWRPVRPAPADPARMTVTLVIANPKGFDAYSPEGRVLAPVDVAAERARARAALTEIDPGGIRELSEAAPDVGGAVPRATLENLLAALRDGCDLLYFVCHGVVIGSETQLWLENDGGRVDTVSGSELLARVRELPQLPRLVVLASCQSAGTGAEARAADGGALAALGPRLVEAGVPAVVAMQGDVYMDTVGVFMPRFFGELVRHGEIDRAAAVARAAARGAGRPDWWCPVLFHRLPDGRLWSRPAWGSRTDAPEDLIGELRQYLSAVADRSAQLSNLFPGRLRKPSQEGTGFDQLRQQVRVLEDRSALERVLAAEREQLRAHGLDPDALAYTPGRGRVDREAEEGREAMKKAPVPRVWDDQAAGSFRRAVILADPGFGKTWLLRHEARRVACRALRQLEEEPPDPEAIEVPVFCRLSDLARSDGYLEDALVDATTPGHRRGFGTGCAAA